MSKASVWWAEKLLLAQWLDTVDTLYNALHSDWNTHKNVGKGVAYLSPSKNQIDITSLDFFDVSFNFFGSGANQYYVGAGVVKQFIDIPDVGGTDIPPIWRQADALAKAMYSAILTDLGQFHLSVTDNIVARADSLQPYSQKFLSIAEHSVIYYITDRMTNSTYEELYNDHRTGPQRVAPPVISTSYLCSVPRLESVGTIFISVLLADLVLLSTVWKLYCLVVEHFFM